MKISEYVTALEAIRTEHGDLEVETDNMDRRFTAPHPTIAYRKVLSKREHCAKFWYDWGAGHRHEEKQGEKVVRV